MMPMSQESQLGGETYRERALKDLLLTAVTSVDLMLWGATAHPIQRSGARRTVGL
jgi:hypothetical protein